METINSLPGLVMSTKRLRKATQVMTNNKDAMCYNVDRFITDALCYLALSGHFSLVYKSPDGWTVSLLDNCGNTLIFKSSNTLVDALCDMILRDEK
jgi:hypothetical protein